MPPQNNANNQVPPVAPVSAPAQTQSSAPVQASQALAIIALVLSIIGLIPWAGVVFAIIAIVLGFVALSQIKKGKAAGRGLALAGTIIGFCGLVLTTISFIMVIIAGFRVANEASKIAGEAMRAQQNFSNVISSTTSTTSAQEQINEIMKQYKK